MIEPRTIDHIHLMVSDREQATAYYRSLFAVSARVHPVNARVTMIETPHVHFFIKQVDVPPEFLALQHISFAVENLSEIVTLLHKRGIDYKIGMFEHFEHSTYKWIEWCDPDGIMLECVEML